MKTIVHVDEYHHLVTKEDIELTKKYMLNLENAGMLDVYATRETLKFCEGFISEKLDEDEYDFYVIMYLSSYLLVEARRSLFNDMKNEVTNKLQKELVNDQHS